MSIAYIGLGSNMGDKVANINKAIEELGKVPGNKVLAVSSFYSAEPVGDIVQDWFINAAAKIETSLPPMDLLKALLMIEKELGRVREARWGPRVIDLDILMYDDLIMDKSGLAIPHPFMHERGFVLMPLAEIAAEVIHPVKGKSIKDLLINRSDRKKVERTGGRSG